MSEGKRLRLSLTRRSDIWSRWKAGQSLHEIGRAFGKPHTSIRCCLAEGSLPQFVVAHGSRSHWLSERTSREGLLPARRFVRLLDASIGLPRR